MQQQHHQHQQHHHRLRAFNHQQQRLTKTHTSSQLDNFVYTRNEVIHV